MMRSHSAWPVRFPASLVLALLLSAGAVLPAQEDTGATHAIASWIALPASPGRERGATEVIQHALPGWRRDAAGNLVLARGSGAPRRIVACGLDEAAYAVSEITPDGYLRLHDAGNERRSPLWDQFHEGQRVLVQTARGPVAGVVAVRSVHLWRRRAAAEQPASIEELWVDVGARSNAEARALGIALLDPVTRDWPRWTFADLVAGPAAASRTGCAAVAAAARDTPERGRTVFVLSTRSTFGWAGLAAALWAEGGADTLVLVSSRPFSDSARTGPGVARRELRPTASLLAAGARSLIALDVSARFPGTLVETVSTTDAAALLRSVAAAAGLAPDRRDTLAYAALPAASAPAPARRDSLSGTAEMLGALSDLYGVSGHEGAVRDAIRRRLPPWAAARARVDTAGNLWIAAGPDRDVEVFVAHMDEVGFDVTGIAPDGVVSLRRRGGFFQSLWEGQTALLHLDDGVLRGVFVPRATASTREPERLTAWFGMDSAALAGRGVRVGSWLTSAKQGTRLGRTRFTNRALDDRTGCTALLLALGALDPSRLTHRVVFLFSVREEIGLEGAAAAANQLGEQVRRVYAVDTFVSSDSPLESPRFALAPLGEGPVARALDNSSATDPADVDRVAGIARAARIPLQIGTTNGGNDGSEFVPHGAADVPLAWPLRYSHSPAEVDDLRDVTALGRLIATLARR